MGYELDTLSLMKEYQAVLDRKKEVVECVTHKAL